MLMFNLFENKRIMYLFVWYNDSIESFWHWLSS